MMQHQTFQYKTVKELLQQAQTLGVCLPIAEQTEPLSQKLQLGGKYLKNRLLAQPIEGFDANPDGSATAQTCLRYQKYAAGGSGTIWVESVAVCPQGRSNPLQLWVTQKNVESFAALRQSITEAASGQEPPYTVVQLTHSGRYSAPNGLPAPACAVHNPHIPKEGEYLLTDAALEELEEDYVQAALLVEQAGFDAVDIRACHGYLINELLGARTREGIYGGSFENRTRFLCNIIDKIKVKSSIEVAVRLNIYDAIPYPFGFGVGEDGTADLQEPLQLAKMLTQHGVRLLNLSCGIGAYSPQVIRPSDSGGEIYCAEHPMEGVARMLLLTKQVKEAVPQAIVVASAFSWLREFGAMVAAGGIRAGWFDVAGFGRQLLCYPHYANDALSPSGMQRRYCCTTCNACRMPPVGYDSPI